MFDLAAPTGRHASTLSFVDSVSGARGGGSPGSCGLRASSASTHGADGATGAPMSRRHRIWSGASFDPPGAMRSGRPMSRRCAPARAGCILLSSSISRAGGSWLGDGTLRRHRPGARRARHGVRAPVRVPGGLPTGSAGARPSGCSPPWSTRCSAQGCTAENLGQGFRPAWPAAIRATVNGQLTTSSQRPEEALARGRASAEKPGRAPRRVRTGVALLYLASEATAALLEASFATVGCATAEERSCARV